MLFWAPWDMALARAVRSVASSELVASVASSTPATLGVIALVSLAVHRLSYSPNFALMRRRIHVYSVASRIIAGLQLTKIRADQLPEIHANALWAVTLRTYAEEMYAHSLQLRGLWVKQMQFMGARPDVLPPAAISVLRRLHDAVPATPFEQVRVVVEQDLGGKVDDLFLAFEPTALASASIGQVHRATLQDGREVVVKVQHPGVSEKIKQDLINMGKIMTWVEWLNPEVQVRPVLEEWSKEVTKELDFKNEMRNMLVVGKNLAATPASAPRCQLRLKTCALSACWSCDTSKARRLQITRGFGASGASRRLRTARRLPWTFATLLASNSL